MAPVTSNSTTSAAQEAQSSAPLRIIRPGGLRATLAFLRDTFSLLESVSTTGDIILTTILGAPTVVLGHPAPVSELLRDAKGTWIKDRFSQRAADVFGGGLLLSEGDTWKRQRRLLNPGFAAARFEAYAATMRTQTASAVARWPHDGVIDAAAELSRLTLDVAVRTLFGADISDVAAQRVSDAFAAVSDFYASPLAMLPFDVPKWLPLPVLRRHVRAVAELDAVVHELIQARRAGAPSRLLRNAVFRQTHPWEGGSSRVSLDERGSGTDTAEARQGADDGVSQHPASGDDLLSMLLAARDDEGGLSDTEVRDQAVTFLLAGHETTALGLTFAMFELGRHASLRQRLHDEVDAAPVDADAVAFPYTTQVFQESLRLYPPAFALSRENVRDTSLGGVPIAKGTTVIAPPWTLHRDPRFHPEPLAFRPDRFTPAYEAALPLGAYLPFGLGPRKCIGTRFAMIEAALLLSGIARAYDWSSVDDALPPLQPAITCRPTGPVRLAVKRRRASDRATADTTRVEDSPQTPRR
jgi:cytochrome P450